jgi:mannose-6-phosphate isomerase
MLHSLDLDNFSTERQWLSNWLFDLALPFWGGFGVDHQSGGFFEKLDDHAAPIDVPRRARLVARQIFVYATAHTLGWNGAALEIVDHGLTFLLDKMVAADGTITPEVASDGTAYRTGFDLYDCAFVLLALASAARVYPERRPMLEQRARAVLHGMAGYAHPAGGYHRSIPPSGPLSSNPHMHLLEACLAWEASSEPFWRERADVLAELCLAHFIDRQSGAVGEYFDLNWGFVGRSEGQVIAPGHQFEWAWLLMRWAARRGRDDVLQQALRLVEIGESRGVDTRRGIVIDELYPDLSVRDAAARLWPQTERIKAWTRLAQLTGDAPARHDALDRAACAIAGLRRYCRGRRPGMWWETIRPDGTCDPDATRASSLYHIVCAAEELQRSVIL